MTASDELRGLAEAASTDGHGDDISTWTSHHVNKRDARLHGPDGESSIRGSSSGPHGRGMRPHLHPPVADYIAAVQPTVGLVLAEVFDAWARMADMDPDLLHRVGGPETLAAARQILGSADG